MKKNAFTLVELLAVLIIIGILAAISITVYTNSIVESKNSLSDFQKKQLIEATRTYVAINTIDFNNKFNSMTIGEDDSCVAVAIKVLITKGLIGQNVVDPNDVNKNLDGYIEISYDAATSQYKYEYKEGNIACQYKIIVENDEVVEVKE